MWVYWATTIPATIVVVVLWQIWLANSDAIVHFLESWMKWATALWSKPRTAPTNPAGREQDMKPVSGDSVAA